MLHPRALINRGTHARPTGPSLVRWQHRSARLPTLPSALAVAVGGLGISIWLGHPAAIVLWLTLPLVAVAASRPMGAPATTAIIVGHDPIVQVVAAALGDPRCHRTSLPYGRRPVKVLHAATLEDAEMQARRVDCDEVVVASPLVRHAPELVDARGRRVTLVSADEVLERLLGRVPLDLPGQDQELGSGGGAHAVSSGYGWTKRGLDIVVSLAVGLAVLPLVPLVAAAIRLDSTGPAFYTQKRVGLGGRTFRIFKFRTMCQDAERNGAVWAQVADPRVTRVGRFLRLTRIDELPQLWNVLRGEMTLVGPRPERPEFTSELERVLPTYAKRHAVKPGLTGWAQVCYRYASTVGDARTKLEYDLFYLRHASFWLDLHILLRTVAVVARLRGR